MCPLVCVVALLTLVLDAVTLHGSGPWDDEVACDQRTRGGGVVCGGRRAHDCNASGKYCAARATRESAHLGQHQCMCV